MRKNVTTITWIFSVIFLVLAAKGFIPNLLTVENDLFKTNEIEDLTYLITAIGFATITKLNISASIQFILVVGVTYMLISLIGFIGMGIRIDEEWGAIINFNLTSYVQFGVGIILCILGSNLRNRHLAIGA